MKGSVVWLLLLLQVATVTSQDAQKVMVAQDDEPAVATPNDDTQKSPPTAGMVPVPPAQEQPPRRHPGADLVDTALEALKKIPRRTRTRTRRQRSILDTVLDYVVNALPSLEVSAPPTEESKPVVSGQLLDAVKLLEQSALLNNPDALYILADMNFYGNYSYPRDLTTAFSHYKTLADTHGNATAQHMTAVFYSTGLGGAVAPDSSKAMLYYTFAALQGNTKAEMAIGYRHHSGVATAKSCETAVQYYKKVADKAIKWYRSGPPGGMAWIVEQYRIADEEGGVYGEGASASSAGLNAIKASVNSDVNAAIDDVIEYLDLMSQRGDFKASFNLGRIYYDGQRGLARNVDMARKYFFMVAKRYWKKDGRIIDTPKPGIEKIAGRAAGFIGRMYLRGDGVDQSLEQAFRWFGRGIKLGDAQSQYGLGLMKLHGYGNAPKNVKAATELFKAAAEQDYAPAQIEMGVLYLDQGGADDVRIASNYFELAARYGLIEAHYYLAEMSNHGVGRDKTCSVALAYYKNVAEKAEPLVSSWAEANQAYEEGDSELAFLEYVLAAEQGYERAQNNVAYMLDPTQARLSLSSLIKPAPRPALLDNPRLALMYWTRSSRQSNVDSQVKMGDYYYYGVGTELDIGKAVQCYTGASDYSQSAQALWNLGWMHEHGIGLTQDYHLAKRFYDQALEVNEEAYLPVKLTLLRLRLKSAWNTFTRGPIHSIQDDPEPKKDWSLGEWISNFMKDDNAFWNQEDFYDDIYDDTAAHAEAGDDFIFEDDMTESLLIVFIGICLVLLLYYRQQMQQRHRRDEEARRLQQQQGIAPNAQAQQPPPPPPPAQEDRGMFPAQGNPAFNDWVAGGVGH
ncbi:Ornithine aminotransferase [Verticillium dahliae VDG1]|nr:Ornithine aminotransferase [Verticillium dahliae VDG1]